MTDHEPALFVVDSANVVGSVPDGWWRDRAGATERLRDSLVAVSAGGLSEPDVPAWLRGGPLDVVLVVEGRARGVSGADGVRVVAAPGSGDDTIVQVVAGREPGGLCAVVTADRPLRARVEALGAVALGPHVVHPARRGQRNGTARGANGAGGSNLGSGPARSG